PPLSCPPASRQAGPWLPARPPAAAGSGPALRGRNRRRPCRPPAAAPARAGPRRRSQPRRARLACSAGRAAGQRQALRELVELALRATFLLLALVIVAALEQALHHVGVAVPSHPMLARQLQAVARLAHRAGLPAQGLGQLAQEGFAVGQQRGRQQAAGAGAVFVQIALHVAQLRLLSLQRALALGQAPRRVVLAALGQALDRFEAAGLDRLSVHCGIRPSRALRLSAKPEGSWKSWRMKLSMRGHSASAASTCGSLPFW